MKVYIREIPTTFSCEVFIVDMPKSLGRRDVIQFLNFKETGEAVETERVNNSEMKLDDIAPTMILPQNRLNEILQAFTEAVRERGFGYENESTAKGKLEATEKHLEDMRRLVFETDKEVVISGKPII